MSHVVSIETELRDLEAVKSACKRLGFAFKENQTTFRWYGRWVDDYHQEDAAYRHGIKPEEYGKCAHAIAIPGAEYEIGLVKHEDHHRLVFDFIDRKLNQAIGGKGAGRFLQTYLAEAAKLEAHRLGYPCTETQLENGWIKVQIQETY
jgi:hypothetical protein